MVMDQESGGQPLDDDALLLERQLETLRRGSVQCEEVLLLERRLAAVRSEQAALTKQFAHLFAHQHYRALCELAARFVGPTDAKDLIGNIFIAEIEWIKRTPLSKVREQLRSPELLRRNLYTLTTYRAYDHLRKRKSQNEGLAIDNEIHKHAVVEALTPSQHADLARLERAYATLPPGQRLIHILQHYYGFTDTEIETLTGVKKTYVRTLAHRARRALKRAMEMRK